MPESKHLPKLAAAIAGLAVMASPLLAQITVVNTGAVVSATADDPKTAVLSFNAGATADKLIVQVSAEGQNVASITYQGAPLAEAVAGIGRNKGIYYLDHPFTGGAADLSVALGEGNSGGIAVGVVSISGSAPGVAASAVANGAASVTLAVPAAGSFVVCGYAANASGTITLPSGHTAIYNPSNIGSAHAAASHANGQPAGSRTYAYGDTNPTSPVASAAVFVPATAAPVIVGTSPTAGAIAVEADANLIITFSQTIQQGTGNLTIHKADGTVVETIGVTTAAVTMAGGEVTINPANDFVAGTGYYVLIDSTAFRNGTGQSYAGISDPTVWNFTALPDLTTVDGRLEWALQQNISNPWPSTTGAPGLASYALAAMHLGTELERANDFINQFHSQFPVPDSDTIDFDSYFWLHLIWRIYHDPAMNARLTPQSRANIEDMMWCWIRTRSRLSEATGTVWVYHGSENHDAMQKTGFLLCAEALKDAPGYGPDLVLADGGTIAQHAAGWSDYFQRYFVGRAREGINAEIASPIYAKYTMGTLTFDMNRDYLQIIDQNRAIGVMFASGINDRVMVFGKGAAGNNKSYADLSGVTRENCMIVQRDQNANSSGSGTLAFVPQKLWDSRVETGGWLFLQAGNGYCALRPADGTYSATTAAHGADLAMSNIWAPVIIQMGQAVNYADFAAFQSSVIANPLTFSSNILNYTSEAGDTFTFYANSKTTPRVNGTTVNLNPTKTYDSPYLSMVHGTDIATVSHPGHPDLHLSFDPGSTGFIGVTASAQRFQDTNSPTNTLADFTVAPGSNRKLVLTASWESTNGDISATCNGSENFSLAVKRGGGRNSAILYLDNPTPGTGNIVVTFRRILTASCPTEPPTARAPKSISPRCRTPRRPASPPSPPP